MTSPSISVCFPAYNEEATIRVVLEEAHALLDSSGLDYEILVCDDASRDRTKEIVVELAGRLPRLRFLSHASNEGIRATFEHLYREARHDFVFLNSTDGQWATAVLFDLLPMTESYDVVIASRRDKGYTAWRRVISWTFNAIPRLVFGVKTYDAGAVKLVKREIIERFTLVSRSPFSEAERLIRAQRAGYRIAEHPVEVRRRRSGKAGGARWRLLAQALADVVNVSRDLKREARLSASKQESSLCTGPRARRPIVPLS